MMTGMTCSNNLANGFAEFFGGHEKMQKSARMHLIAIREKLTADLEKVKGKTKAHLNAGAELVSRAQAAKIITSKMLSEIVQHLQGYADAYMELFVTLQIPDGEGKQSMYKKIQEKLKPDPVAETNFFYTIAVLKAFMEMDDHFLKE